MASQTELTTSRLPGAAVTAPAGQAASAPQGKRLLFVDNLRILLICGVVMEHISVTYGGAGSWMYHDPATADAFTTTFLSMLDGIGMAVGMGFFFLLAGYFTPRSYDRKGGVAYRRNWLDKVTPSMGRNWALIALLATNPFFGVAVPYGLRGGTAGGHTGIELAGGLHWLSLAYTLWESFVIVGVCLGLLVLFRTRWNHQGKLVIGLAASVYTVYLIHPVVLVGFAYAFHVVTLYPLLKWGIAILVTIPLCFLLGGLIRKIPLLNRAL
jgi:hypothetical protein